MFVVVTHPKKLWCPDRHYHPCVQVVLREVIEALGGWEAAFFLDSGGVNLDIDVDAWPVEDKVRHIYVFICLFVCFFCPIYCVCP